MAGTINPAAMSGNDPSNSELLQRSHDKHRSSYLALIVLRGLAWKQRRNIQVFTGEISP